MITQYDLVQGGNILQKNDSSGEIISYKVTLQCKIQIQIVKVIDYTQENIKKNSLLEKIFKKL